MPRSAIYKSSRAVRTMSVELVDGIFAERGARDGFTFDEGAMRLFYTMGDHAVRAMLRLEEEQQAAAAAASPTVE